MTQEKLKAANEIMEQSEKVQLAQRKAIQIFPSQYQFECLSKEKYAKILSLLNENYDEQLKDLSEKFDAL